MKNKSEILKMKFSIFYNSSNEKEWFGRTEDTMEEIITSSTSTKLSWLIEYFKDCKNYSSFEEQDSILQLILERCEVELKNKFNNSLV